MRGFTETHMRKLVFAVAAAFSLVALHAQASDIEVVNKSKTTIQHIYVSETDSNRWGDDQLGDDEDDTIAPGDSYTIEDIDAGRYDLKLVATDGTTCIIHDQRIGTDKVWTVTEAMLDSCH
jgi:hypothetical protein